VKSINVIMVSKKDRQFLEGTKIGVTPQLPPLVTPTLVTPLPLGTKSKARM